jgi:hypothetical protein
MATNFRYSDLSVLPWAIEAALGEVSELLHGVVPPDASIGQDNDWYIDTTTKLLYGPKTSGVWTAFTDLDPDETLPLDAEGIQDAIGAIVDSTLVYDDATPSLGRAAITGAVTVAVNSNVSALADNAVTESKIANLAISNRVMGIYAVNTGNIANQAVGNWQLAHMPEHTVKGRASSGTGLVEDIGSTAFVDVYGDAIILRKTLIDAKGDLLAGSANNTAIRVPVGTDGQVLTASSASAGGVAWAAGGGGGGLTDGDKGDITVGGTGTTLTIDNGAVTSAKMANMAQGRVKGRAATAGTGVPGDLSVYDLGEILNTAAFTRPPLQVMTTSGSTAMATPWEAGIYQIFDGTNPALTIPPSPGTPWALGTILMGSTSNTGMSFVQGAGVTITSRTGTLVTTGAKASWTLVNIGTNSWYLSGDLVGAQTIQTINTQTGTTYTLVLTDSSKLVTVNNAAAITLTVPTNASVAFPVGTRVDLAQLGAGKITVAPAGGVTVNGTPSLGFRAQYSGASLYKLATDTWLLVGDLA